MKAVIEGDELLYNVAFGVQAQAYLVRYKDGKEYDVGVDLTATEIKDALKNDGVYGEDYEIIPYTIVDDLEVAIKDLDNKIANIKTLQLETSPGVLRVINSIELWLSPKDHSNFRYNKVSIPGPGGLGYKVNRALRAKPLHLQALRKYIIEQHGAKEIKGYEADDALGMYAKDDSVLIHEDKDIDMIPGWHYNPRTKESYYVADGLGTLELIKKSSGYKLVGRGLIQFYAQLLIGDTTDNIPGIRGFGHKRTYDLLQLEDNEQDVFNLVMEKYVEQYKEYAIDALMEVADLVWICRKDNETGSQYLRNKGFI